MESSLSSDQVTLRVASESFSLAYLLERGIDCTRQGSYVEGAAFFVLARERLTPDQMHLAVEIDAFLQIAMSLRDTTTDENELAMGYTVPQERLRRGRSSTWCYEPATNLIGDVFRHPPSVAPTRGST